MSNMQLKFCVNLFLCLLTEKYISGKGKSAYKVEDERFPAAAAYVLASAMATVLARVPWLNCGKTLSHIAG